MYILRLSNDRGQTLTDWLNSRHTFSFGTYFDPNFRGFSDLLVINDDIVAPSQGFGMHPHDNMEIISIVLSGRSIETVWETMVLSNREKFKKCQPVSE